MTGRQADRQADRQISKQVDKILEGFKASKVFYRLNYTDFIMLMLAQRYYNNNSVL